MKGYAMLGIGKTGWIEKERPLCGPLDAIVRPIAVSPCTSDVHTVWEGAIGDRHNMILGHEAVGEVVEVGCARARLQVRRPRHHPCHHARLGCARIAGGLFHALRRHAGGLEILELQGRRLCRILPRQRGRCQHGSPACGCRSGRGRHAGGHGPDGLPRRGAGRCAVRR